MIMNGFAGRVGSNLIVWAVLLATGLSATAAPIANNQNATVAEGARSMLAPLSSSTGGSYSKYTIMSLPAHGTLEYKDSAGVWRAYAAGQAVAYENSGYQCYFTASPGYLGTDSFTWKVTDPQTNVSNVATFSLTINRNSAPTANNSTLSLATGVKRKGCPLNSYDADAGQELTYSLVAPPAHGTLEWLDGTVSPGVWRTVTAGVANNSKYWYFSSTPGYSGADSFTWKTSDGVTNSNTGTVSITITPNTVPVAYDQKRVILKNEQLQIQYWYSDPDGQSMTTTIVTPPAHGTIAGTTYTPAPNYLGTDSFTWRVSDGVTNSGLATCRILAREITSRAGMLVMLIVRDTLLPEIAGEINRLKADIEHDGYTAKILPFSGTSCTDVKNIIKSEYMNPDQFVSGAILIGNIPAHSQGADTYYWQVEDVTPGSLDLKLSLWVSRIWATGFSGGEVKRIKWALDANHAYRTGASRLPWTTYCRDEAARNQRVPSTASDIYGVPAQVVATDTAVTQGGEILDEEAHLDSWVGSNAAGGHPSQVRYGLFSSCSSGRLGGPVNQNLMRYGGGNILSVGAFTTTYEMAFMLLGNKTVLSVGSTADLRARLAAGDTWGDMSVAKFVWESLVVTGIWHGDMSLGVKRYPANALPVFSSFTADKTSGNAPLTVTLAAAASDPDGSVTNYEWFVTGFNGGYNGPTHSGTSGNLTHTFALAHRYPVEVQAVDNYMARAWVTKDIVAAPELNKPLRVRCGRNFTYFTAGWDYTSSNGVLYLHDQAFAAGTWGYSGGNEGYVNAAVSNTVDDALFQYFRSGPEFTYRVPVTNGTYCLNLCFADMLSSTTGQRIADVDVEGITQLSGLDVFAQLGGKAAGVVPVYVTVADRELTFRVKKNAASLNDVFLNSFEILPYTAGNSPPLAQSQSVSTARNTAKTITLTATDADGDAMTYSVVTPPAHGTLSGTAPVLTYTPASGFVGSDSFTFRARDGKTDGNPATVNITVQGMLAWWKLDETGGTNVNDATGNGYNGTLQGSASWTTGGKLEGALQLSTTNDMFLSSVKVVPLGAEWTITAWFTAPLPGTATWHTLTRGQLTDHHIIADSSLNLGVYASNNGDFRSCGYNLGGLAGGWHHVTAVGSGSTTTFYVDGVAVGSSDRKITADVYAIGNWQGGGQRFSDRIDDIRVYNYALGGSEITALANPGTNQNVDSYGIPDAWKVRYFGSAAATNASAMDDADGDGMCNLAEYVAGTSPTNPASFLRIQDSGYQAGSFGLSFGTTTGRLYDVKYTDDLTATNWTVLTNDLPGTGGQVQVTDTNKPNRRFFRIGVKME